MVRAGVLGYTFIVLEGSIRIAAGRHGDVGRRGSLGKQVVLRSSSKVCVKAEKTVVNRKDIQR